MQNRFLLAMIVSFLILTYWGSQQEQVKKDANKTEQTSGEKGRSGDSVGDQGQTKNPGAGLANQKESPGEPQKTQIDKIVDAAPHEGPLALQSAKIRYEFDQRGASLTSAFFLDQFQTVEDKANAKNVDTNSKEGKLEFITHYQGGEKAFELFDRNTGAEQAGWANQHLWQTTGPSADGKTIVFELAVTKNGQSFVLKKSFSLNESDRRLNVALSLDSKSPGGVTREFWMNTSGGVFPPERAYLLPNDPKSYGHSLSAIRDSGEMELTKVSVSDVLEANEQSKVMTSSLFTCDMGIYFGAYLWPKTDGRVSDVRLRAADPIAKLNLAKVQLADLEKYGPMRVWSQVGTILTSNSPGHVVTNEFDYYLGPKDHRVIKEAFANDPEKLDAYLAVADAELTAQSIACCTSGPLGWLIQSVSKAVIWLLSFFTGLLGSTGLAIILLTVCVKIVMFPITRKSQTSMHIHGKKMAKLKPKIEALKERYKNDPQKLQKAHMALLKESDTKLLPLGGCLPMLLNIPVFFGLFSAIRFDYELRHASFLWCTDLSMPDRFIPWDPFSLPCFCGPGLVIAGLNILPLLMIAAMFFHQMGMPKSPDPQMQQQQKMMMFMPLMFGVFMYAYAAGLSVYWLSSSLFGIFEQRVIKKLFPIDKGEEGQGDVKVAKSK